MGIYHACGSVRRICLTSLLKQIMCMMYGETILCWIQQPERSEATTAPCHRSNSSKAKHIHPVGTCTQSTHIHLIWTPGRALRGALTECPFLWIPNFGSHLLRSSVLLWDCGNWLMVSWWLLGWSWEPESGVLFELPSVCHCFSAFLCGCRDKLLSHNIQVLALTQANFVSSSCSASGSITLRTYGMTESLRRVCFWDYLCSKKFLDTG